MARLYNHAGIANSLLTACEWQIRKKSSFVIVMPVGGNHEDDHFSLIDAIDHAVLLGDFAAPTSFRLASQRFGVTETRLGMLLKFFDESLGFLIGFWLAFGQPSQILICLDKISDFICHNQAS